MTKMTAQGPECASEQLATQGNITGCNAVDGN
jgi:hypothetical protein